MSQSPTSSPTDKELVAAKTTRLAEATADQQNVEETTNINKGSQTETSLQENQKMDMSIYIIIGMVIAIVCLLFCVMLLVLMIQRSRKRHKNQLKYGQSKSKSEQDGIGNIAMTNIVKSMKSSKADSEGIQGDMSPSRVRLQNPTVQGMGSSTDDLISTMVNNTVTPEIDMNTVGAPTSMSVYSTDITKGFALMTPTGMIDTMGMNSEMVTNMNGDKREDTNEDGESETEEGSDIEDMFGAGNVIEQNNVNGDFGGVQIMTPGNDNNQDGNTLK